MLPTGFLVYNQMVSNQLVVNTRYATRRITGVERYAAEIVKRLGSQLHHVSPPVAMPWGLGHGWEQLILPQLVNPGDLLWSPANSGPLVLSDQVLTIHDLAWRDHPQGYKHAYSTWYRFLLPRLIQRVRSVITVSQYIKLRITSTYQISGGRVYVVPGGIDRNKFAPVKDARQRLVQYTLPERYLLFLGTLARHKNLARLCNAWQLLRQRYPEDSRDVALVLAGGIGQAFRKLNLPLTDGVLLLGYIPEQSLAALYTAALAFIIPSAGEGFGLTCLEAMACGVPVLASRAGALPEVAGEAALYFDPLDTDEIAASLHRILQNADLRDDLMERGYARAASFSWDASTAQVQQILQSTAQ